MSASNLAPVLELAPKQLGGGTYGEVYGIAGTDGSYVAKYDKFTEGDEAARARNLRHIQYLIEDFDRGDIRRLRGALAWPEAFRRAQHPTKGEVDVLVMRNVDQTELIAFADAANRQRFFAEADNVRTSVRIAIQLVDVVGAVHDRGYIIRDFQPQNVHLDQATMAPVLIDCDSFFHPHDPDSVKTLLTANQYRAPEAIGDPEFIATQEQDRFALAVWVFYLLTNCSNPFAGPLRDPNGPQLSLDERVKGYHFAASRRADVLTRPREAPNADATLDFFPSDIADYFERAFGPVGVARGRPTARQWLRALIRYETGLREKCDSTSHAAFETLRECPWCKLARENDGRHFYKPTREAGAPLPPRPILFKPAYYTAASWGLPTATRSVRWRLPAAAALALVTLVGASGAWVIVDRDADAKIAAETSAGAAEVAASDVITLEEELAMIAERERDRLRAMNVDALRREASGDGASADAARTRLAELETNWLAGADLDQLRAEVSTGGSWREAAKDRLKELEVQSWQEADKADTLEALYTFYRSWPEATVLQQQAKRSDPFTRAIREALANTGEPVYSELSSVVTPRTQSVLREFYSPGSPVALTMSKGEAEIPFRKLVVRGTSWYVFVPDKGKWPVAFAPADEFEKPSRVTLGDAESKMFGIDPEVGRLGVEVP